MKVINLRVSTCLLSIATSCFILTSCSNNDIKPPQKSFEKVAKDWSMTVRASQVMPLFPLEEDIRPGDIYLVDKSIDSEVKTWDQKGFLPLNNRFDRMQIPQEAFDSFYAQSSDASDPVSYSRPPKVAFPSYTFEVDRRGALGLAVPLSSVPVAISASGAQRATGSVVFDGATTQGLPDLAMQRQINRWKTTHKAELADRAKQIERPLILRLITRTFSIQGATVSLVFESQKGANLQVGSTVPASPKVATSSAAQDETLSEEYEALITEINQKIALEKTNASDQGTADLEAQLVTVKQLQAQYEIKSLKRKIERKASEERFGGYLLPSGSAKVVGRSARGVTMEEVFDKPLVLGYWATEYLVTEEGSLRPLGSVMDLIDNPEEYNRLIEKARSIQTRAADDSTKDTGVASDNIFLNKPKQ